MWESPAGWGPTAPPSGAKINPYKNAIWTPSPCLVKQQNQKNWVLALNLQGTMGPVSARHLLYYSIINVLVMLYYSFCLSSILTIKPLPNLSVVNKCSTSNPPTEGDPPALVRAGLSTSWDDGQPFTCLPGVTFTFCCVSRPLDKLQFQRRK